LSSAGSNVAPGSARSHAHRVITKAWKCGSPTTNRKNGYLGAARIVMATKYLVLGS